MAATDPFADDFGSPGSRGNTLLPFPPIDVSIEEHGEGETRELRFRFSSTEGLRYTLAQSVDLIAWPPAENVPAINGDSGEQMFTIPFPSSTEMFFRIDFEWPGS